MDLKIAVRTYQFAERAKSELIVGSQLATALIQFPIQEKPGGKRMLLMVLGSIRSELEFAYGDTERREFRSAIDHLNEAISLTESMELGAASERLSRAVSAVTTAAQEAWDTLQEHELL
ncbi:hypothetical protein KH990_10210 [Methanoculleus bourgensis]|jgi:hypothetical protein|uniref:Uncharacterized protein n=1 Tax=Methanoculleus bourgensis TaxID=83986 RepID=A0A0X3BKF0_9EURY|nr:MULTISPECIES: hypothetical protein [Methanoculleus]MBT0733733.1 hypothetical protein [Methanoculleus bourgensis]MDD3372937.1 hypothetical protein [Methanoculleus bourgensis]NMA88188.1 hypothetical protein [Methanoculleus bourgensis]NQS77172.1 hypothetical protein [Methanoculleus bourgensis]CVK32399.1 conserved protein of unknown function [Methanoculleus bourgensis]